MRKALFAVALALLVALQSSTTASAQVGTTTTTTPGVPSTGYETDITTSITLGVTALAAILALAYFFGQRRRV